jgi:hypothetical protein
MSDDVIVLGMDAPIILPELLFGFQGCDVVELELARRVLYLCGFRARREVDNLLVFPPKLERDLSLKGRITPFYAPGKEDCRAEDAVGELFIDEGIYSDTLRSDLSRGYNNLWSELVIVEGLAQVLQSYFHPETKIIPSPYMGHGATRNHYAAQYVEALVSGDQNKHPRVRFMK